MRRIWWQAYRVPYRAAFVSAHGAELVREGILIGVECTGGSTGLGEAAPLPAYAGGNMDETAAAIDMLARGLIGCTADDAWMTTLPLSGMSAGAAAAARCGIETAIADLLARQEGILLANWLGSRAGVESGEIARTVPVNATIDASDTPSATAAARAFRAAGFETLKLKVGLDESADLQRVAAVREAVGPGVALRIDANGAWTFDDAVRLLPLYALLGVGLCEQPISRLAPGALEQMAALRRVSPILIATDESCRSEADVAAIIAAGAADVLVVKPMVSGLREAVTMLARAGEARLPAIVTTLFETGVGVAMTAHLAALLGDSSRACGLATLDHLEASLVVSPPRIENGRMSLPPGAGLGVTIDEPGLAEYASGPLREVRQ